MSLLSLHVVESVFRRIHDIRERINARTVIEDLHAPENTDFSEHVNEPGEYLRSVSIYFNVFGHLFLLDIYLNPATFIFICRYPKFRNLRVYRKADAGVCRDTA